MVSKKFSYEHESYTSETGVLYETHKDMIVEFTIDVDQCTLSANKQGLLALAKSLIKLADDDVPVGCHFHLDPPVFFVDGSAELIIEKI